VALPQGQVPLALVSFNAGVEAGQLAALLALLPVLAWLRRREWLGERRGPALALANAAIVVAGLGWFVARVS
jgi:hypothetical protein